MNKRNKWNSNFSFQEAFLERKSIVLKIVTIIKWEANRLFATNQKIYSELEIEFANIRV